MIVFEYILVHVITHPVIYTSTCNNPPRIEVVSGRTEVFREDGSILFVFKNIFWPKVEDYQIIVCRPSPARSGKQLAWSLGCLRVRRMCTHPRSTAEDTSGAAQANIGKPSFSRKLPILVIYKITVKWKPGLKYPTRPRAGCGAAIHISGFISYSEYLGT